MCRFRAVNFGCGHTLYHVLTPGACYVPGGGWECSSPGMFVRLTTWGYLLGLIQEFEVVHLRCASCVFGTSFPGRTVVMAGVLPNQYFAASSAVQHVWYDHEVRPYLRESERVPRFDWYAAWNNDFSGALEAENWEFHNGY